VALHPTHGSYAIRNKKQPPKPNRVYEVNGLPPPSDFPFKADTAQISVEQESRENLSAEAVIKLTKKSEENGWLSASEVKRSIRDFRGVSTADIERLFLNLQSQNYGIIRGGGGQKIEWKFTRSANREVGVFES